MDIQMFILVKAAFFLERIQRTSLIMKTSKQAKQERYFGKSNVKPDSYCKQLMD